MSKIKMAYELIPDAPTSFSCGFNQRIMGDTYSQIACSSAWDKYDRLNGWNHADNMVNKGEIYYTHVFPHGDCTGEPFTYGGTFVCNKCGRRDLKKPWWNIKVGKDGDAWCVWGEGFENLQESNNYAFGRTEEIALDNYYKIMSGVPLEEEQVTG